MKNTTRQFAVFVLMVILSFVLGTDVRGQVTSFPFGNSTKVEAYAVSKVNTIVIFFWGYDTNGQYIGFEGDSWQNFSNTSTFTNKVDMDRFIAEDLTNILQRVITNTTISNLDKSKGILVDVGCYMIVYDFGMSEGRLFSTPVHINIVPTYENGIYGIPNLSGFSTQLSSDIPFYIPDLRWARLEVGYDGDPMPFDVYDKNIDPSMNLIHDDGFLYLPTDFIVNLYGWFWMKLSIFSGNSFQSFNGDGNLIPEKLMRLGISKSGSSTTITVNGGDSGRGYFLQQSLDMKQWTNCSLVTFVSPLSYLGERKNFEISTGSECMMFRTVTVNEPPSY